jgi:uncharacterized protein YjbI with pentapeptide repeats
LKLNGYTIDHHSDLAGANLSGLEIVNADITQATLAGANLAGSKIVNVQSSGASFERANLVKADLVGEDLEGVDFSHADLTDADLSEANLRGANFLRAKLVRTKFRHANLAGAVLDYCEIERADFRDAEFHGHVELSEEQLLQRGLANPRFKKGEWYDFLPSSGQTRAKQNWAANLAEERRWVGCVTFEGTVVRRTRFTGANFGCSCSNKLTNSNYDGIACGLEYLPKMRFCDMSKANFRQIEIDIRHTNKYRDANMEESIVTLPSMRTSDGKVVGPVSGYWKKRNPSPLQGANLHSATIYNFFITADKKFSNNWFLQGANISGVTFKESYVLETDQNDEIVKQTTLSDFSNYQIRQFLAC